jgi:hypothetical protein
VRFARVGKSGVDLGALARDLAGRSGWATLAFGGRLGRGFYRPTAKADNRRLPGLPCCSSLLRRHCNAYPAHFVRALLSDECLKERYLLPLKGAHACPHSLPAGKADARSACIAFEENRKFTRQNRHTCVAGWRRACRMHKECAKLRARAAWSSMIDRVIEGLNRQRIVVSRRRSNGFSSEVWTSVSRRNHVYAGLRGLVRDRKRVEQESRASVLVQSGPQALFAGSSLRPRAPCRGTCRLPV